jgi:hypothetical protein
MSSESNTRDGRSLLPCPFCGAQATAEKEGEGYPYPWSVFCQHEEWCGLQPLGINHFALHKSLSEIRRAWNARDGKTESQRVVLEFRTNLAAAQEAIAKAEGRTPSKTANPGDVNEQ